MGFFKKRKTTPTPEEQKSYMDNFYAIACVQTDGSPPSASSKTAAKDFLKKIESNTKPPLTIDDVCTKLLEYFRDQDGIANKENITERDCSTNCVKYKIMGVAYQGNGYQVPRRLEPNFAMAGSTC